MREAKYERDQTAGLREKGFPEWKKNQRLTQLSSTLWAFPIKSAYTKIHNQEAHEVLGGSSSSFKIS